MQNTILNTATHHREFKIATTGDAELGPLKLLPGLWANLKNPEDPDAGPLKGRGWNMIALPFAGPQFRYRLLMNQYNEVLNFSTVDDKVPNRGLDIAANTPKDQELAALDYEQVIEQIAMEDFPDSGLAGTTNQPIHHEPGLWLYLKNQNTNNLDIARLSTIPHGNSVLVLGTAKQNQFGKPTIPTIDGLPVGTGVALGHPYLKPYEHFTNPIFGGLFDPRSPNDLLTDAHADIESRGINIVRFTELTVDTKRESGGISNIPFVVKQADASEMTSTFWILETDSVDEHGNPRLFLQYTQTVMLDFFPRRDGVEGLIQWPHVSINTLEKIHPPSAKIKALLPSKMPAM